MARKCKDPIKVYPGAYLQTFQNFKDQIINSSWWENGAVSWTKLFTVFFLRFIGFQPTLKFQHWRHLKGRLHWAFRRLAVTTDCGLIKRGVAANKGRGRKIKGETQGRRLGTSGENTENQRGKQGILGLKREKQGGTGDKNPGAKPEKESHARQGERLKPKEN